MQLATFFAEINDILRRYRAKLKIDPSLILCGDFNSTPNSPLFDFVTNGFLDYEGKVFIVLQLSSYKTCGYWHCFLSGLEAKQLSGQWSRGGKHIKLQPNLLPESLHIDNTCSYTNGKCGKMHFYRLVVKQITKTLFWADEQDRNCGVLQHKLGKLLPSQEYKPDEATTIQDKGITVDYIFHSCDAGANNNNSSRLPTNKACSSHQVQENFSNKGLNCLPIKLKLKGHMSAVTAKEISHANSLPNSYHSSDHLPVAAEFQIILPSK